MNRLIPVFVIISVLCSGIAVYAKGPEVGMIDNKLSVNADGVPLSRLLQLIDRATGMKSKVPPDLANRNISVRFSDMNVGEGMRKLFQGQPFDYIIVPGQGIIVTASSQTLTAGDSASPAAYNPTPQAQVQDQPFVQDFQQVPGAQPMVQTPFGPQVQQFPPTQQQAQPTVIQTPFGPQQVNRNQQQQNTPLSTPGQNSLFPGQGQSGLGTAQPGFPAAPIGFPSPNSQAPVQGAQPQQNNGPFGTPQVFGQTR